MYIQELLIMAIEKIKGDYSLNEFSKLVNIDAGYLSRILNKKRITPPSPKILEKISKVPNSPVSYETLMLICGYMNQPSSAIYDFSSHNDKFIMNTCIGYAVLNKLDTANLDKNSYILKKLDLINNINKELALQVVINEVNKFILFYGYGNIENKTKNNTSFINTKSNKTMNIPVLGKIAAGQPILAQEYLEGYLPVDPEIYGLTSDEECFYLKVAGESMNLKVKNGDYVLVKKQDTAEDGDLIVAIVNGDDEATLKRYKRLNDQFVLLEPMSSDTTIQSITIDLSNDDFKIIGKAIGQFGKF